MRIRRLAIVAALVVLVLAAGGIFLWLRLRATEPRERTVTTYWEADGPSVRPRRESCTTCHKAHPKAEALVAKHPTLTFGCTSCHGGEGGTMTLPHPRVVLKEAKKGSKDSKATLEWASEGLEPGDRREPLLRVGAPAPDFPAGVAPWTIAESSRDAFLLAVPEVQGGCFKCHAADVELAGAPELARGRTLFRDLGCQVCHAVARLPPVTKPGLPVSDVSQRLIPSRVLAYLRDPRAVDHGARMPTAWPAGTDDAARRDETIAIAAFLFERSERREREHAGPNVARAAVVAGASAEEGKLFYDAFGCKGCHDDAPPARALAPSLAAAGDAWTEDWLAAWSRDPKGIYPSARMPSERLSAREAASVAKYLASRHGLGRASDEDVAKVMDPTRRAERMRCAPAGGGGEMSRTQCGELLVVRYACVACHDLEGAEPARAPGPPLDGFAGRARLSPRATLAKLDAPRAADPNARMPDHDLSSDELRAVMVFLAGLGDVTPAPPADASERPDRRAREAGRALSRELQCGGCHDAGRMRGVPSLAGEAARARPEWLFSMLDRPERHGVRPELHPEWVYGDLVPRSKLAARMPSFALPTEGATAIVRALAAESNASFPFAPARPKALSPDERAASAAALNVQCMTCHYLGELPRERAKSDAPLAPSLSRANERLREEWVRAFLPGHVKATLPARLVDFVFWLREGTVLPRPGEEARAPVLGLGD